jgi:LysM repeat protein
MDRSPKPSSTKRRGDAASPNEQRAKRARPISESAPLPRANSQPPAAKATNFAVGTVREGGDGTKWRVVVSASGTTWKLVVGDVSGGQSTQKKVVAVAAAAASGGDGGDDDAAADDTEREGKRSHPFALGDAVEAVFKEGSWALATVRSTRAKQVEVEYVREQEEEPQETGSSGTRYLARENETARGIAARFGLAVGALMHLNSHVDGLTPSAKLRQLTALLLPEAHVARENDTARGVAQQHGRELEELLALNRHALPDVQPGGKLKAGTLVLLPRAMLEGAGGAEGAAEAAAAAKRKKKLKVLPQLGERIEVEVADEDGDGATMWKPAEVRGLLSSGHAPRTTHHAPRTTHHAPRTTHHAPRTTHHAPRTTHHAPLRCAACCRAAASRRVWRRTRTS